MASVILGLFAIAAAGAAFRELLRGRVKPAFLWITASAPSGTLAMYGIYLFWARGIGFA